MALTDKALGLSMLIAAAVIFIYYSLWVIVTPFVDASHPFQAYFPERRWAILLPSLTFVGVLTVTGTFIGLVMLRSGKKPAAPVAPLAGAASSGGKKAA